MDEETGVHADCFFQTTQLLRESLVWNSLLFQIPKSSQSLFHCAWLHRFVRDTYKLLEYCIKVVNIC